MEAPSIFLYNLIIMYFNLNVDFQKAPSEIDECSFLKNTALHGGGIYRDASIMKCRNCIFESNRATGCGGAIYSERGQIQDMESTVFINNLATNGNNSYTYIR